MIVYKNLNIKKNHKNAVIAIGNFDGLHLGHQKVLNHALSKAKKENLKFGVITFEPIPAMFFNKDIMQWVTDNIDDVYEIDCIICRTALYTRLNGESWTNKDVMKMLFPYKR